LRGEVNHEAFPQSTPPQENPLDFCGIFDKETTAGFYIFFSDGR
jgi:hypothetical protein